MIMAYKETGGKIILLGEHAVVYDKHALALPFSSVKAMVEVTHSDVNHWVDTIYYKGDLKDVPNLLQGIATLIEATLDYFKIPQKIHVRIASSIPTQRGMGSSAAVSIALVEAICDLFSCSLDTKTLIHLVMKAENIHHFNASGLDVEVIAYNKAILFNKQKENDMIEVSLDAKLLLVDSGIEGKTKEAVQKVFHLSQDNPKLFTELIDRIDELVLDGVRAIKNHDIKGLGELMNHNHEALRLLGVSHPAIDKLIDILNAHGALGSKLTGGGLGGCLIGLFPLDQSLEKLQELLEKEYGVKTYIHSLKE